MKTKLLAVAALAALLPATAFAASAGVTRTYAAPTAPIAKTVTVPAGYETVYLSGQLPDIADPAKPGNTEEQSESVFSKIDAILAEHGLTAADVVSMTIYLAADPATGKMDFAGMMNAYKKHYRTETQPNGPSRSTVQVAALVAPAALIEVEVTAVRKPK